jgi:Cu+-exporting ATPase
MSTSAPSRLTIRVSGMNCAGCAATVQRAVETLPGVDSVAVSLTDGLATVTGSDIAADALVAAVDGCGFEAAPLEEDADLGALRSDIELRQHQQEHRWRFRAIVGLGLWVPMGLLHWLGPASWSAWTPWAFLAGATVVLATAGAGFYRSAFRAARHGTTNMDTLIAIGATTAYGFSLAVMIARLSGRLLDQPLYFSEAAALLGIISLGHWMEARSTARAGSAVRELLELQPETSELADAIEPAAATIPTETVQPGQRLLIRPGARIPVDGLVREGESAIDESVVTGESLPVTRRPGDPVVAGSVNTSGRLVIESTVSGRDTTVTRIAALVQQAQSSRAEIQRLADRVCAVFVPAVLTIATVTFIGWLIAGSWSTGIVATVSVLIISCPCALGLATPMAVMVGTGAASRRGILVKSAAALETAGRAGAVIFDKTGTLTEGRPSVTKVEVDDGTMTEAALLALAAAVEAPSEHPVATAIVARARSLDLAIAPVADFTALPGAGVRGTVDGRRVEIMRDETATCRVLVDGAPIGRITVSDRVRDDARGAIARLREQGLAVTMLTGDRREVAEAVGDEIGLSSTDVVAGVTPEAKLILVSERRRAGDHAVVMVGDGINDAAALADADLGIAMASGTNIAIESADIVIPGDRVTAVAETITIARVTLRTIRQNLFFAFIYNACAIPAAAFGLLGAHGPIIAALAMAGSDLTVIGNALRAKRILAKGHEGERPSDQATKRPGG